MPSDFMIGPSILMYHSIESGPVEDFTVSVDAFRDQISWLVDNGFEIVSLSFLLRSIRERNYRLLQKKVVITFDDGYRDFAGNALPILLEHGATATVFLVTGMLGEKATWNESRRDAQLMSEEEARHVKSCGITLGSHTVTHENVTLLDHCDLQRQIRESRDALALLGESFFAFSYPWGQWSNRVVDAVKAAGYDCAVTVGEEKRLTAGNAFLLPRITMTRDMELKRYQSLMTRTLLDMELRRGYRALRARFCGSSTNPVHSNPVSGV